MNFGYTPESFGWLILLAFGTIIGFAVLLLLVRIVLRLMGVKKDGLVVMLFFGFGLLAFLGLSLALDRLGERVTGQITTKRESVVVNRRGGWRHDYLLGLRLDAQGLSLPMPGGVDSAMLESFLKDAGTQYSSYSPDVAMYDRLHEGDPLALRVLRIGGLSVLRPADQNTFSALPWGWLLAGLIVISVIIVLWRKLWWLFLIVGVLLFITVPLVNAFRDQLTANKISDKTERATATVYDVKRVLDWNLLRRRSTSRGEYQLAQPYEVVELQFTPRGARSAVIGVDAIDVAANAAPRFAKGQTVEVRYAPDDPRHVRLDGQSRTWHLRDMIGFYMESALTIVIVLVVMAALVWFGWRNKRAKTAPAPPTQ